MNIEQLTASIRLVPQESLESLPEVEPRFADEIVKRYLRYCKDNNIECEVKRNNEPITLDFFEMEMAV